MDKIIEAALAKGMSHLCFTEHMDLDFPLSDNETKNIFLLDTDAYQAGIKSAKEMYSDKITLLFGVEWGMQPHLAEKLPSYVNQYGFDFIIGSEHTTNKKDPYYPKFYEGRSEYEAYCEYFEDIVTNLDRLEETKTSLQLTDNLISTLGHLDYVVRYGPNKNTKYSYSIYGDIIDVVLKRLIDRGIAMEINTGGYKYKLGDPNPSFEVIRRYKELGGELITIGSDAHEAKILQYEFDRVRELLVGCGYKYHAIFINRKPVLLNL